MWVERTKEGYRFIEKYKDPMTDTWKRTSVVRPTKSNTDRNTALRLLEHRISELTQYADSYPFTLREASEAYIAWQYEENKEQSALNAKEECERIMARLGEDVLVSRLTAPYVRENLKMKPETYNVALKRFKALMKWCYENDYIEDARWLDKLHAMKTRSTKDKNLTKYLEHDEINKILEGMENERWRLLTEFLILSGLRVSEAIALLNSDVTDVITVNKTYVIKTGKISSAKTESSCRKVFIQPQLADCVKRIRAFRAKEMMQKGYRTDIFLPNHNGEYCKYAAYAVYFRDAVPKLIGRPVKIHATRHTHVAMLAEAGLSLEEIGRRIGHSDDSKVTRDVYFHVTEKMMEKDREKMMNVKII